jgi:hypothetical protein
MSLGAVANAFERVGGFVHSKLFRNEFLLGDQFDLTTESS